MASLAEHYARLEEEWRQTNHRVVKQDVYEKITHYSPDNASRTFIGDIFCEYVPQVERFQQKPTQHENELEFAPVFQFFFQVFELEDVRRLVEEYFGNLR